MRNILNAIKKIWFKLQFFFWKIMSDTIQFEAQNPPDPIKVIDLKTATATFYSGGMNKIGYIKLLVGNIEYIIVSLESNIQKLCIHIPIMQETCDDFGILSLEEISASVSIRKKSVVSEIIVDIRKKIANQSLNSSSKIDPK